MRLVVLASSESWYLADLRRAAGQRHHVERASFGQLVSRLDEQGCAVRAGEVDLAAADVVLVRTMPPGSLEQVVFRMDALARLEAAGIPVVNPPKALEAAVDKYLASAKLKAAGLPVPRTVVCQTLDDAMTAFESLDRDVVVKPLFGSEGRGMARVSDEAVALRVFKALAQVQSVLYLQEFIPHNGFDLRLLLVGRRVLGMKRINPNDWRTNVARGATTEPFAPTDAMIQMAEMATSTVGAPLAAVDLLPARDGRLFVLEINAVPGWRALAATLQVDVAAMVLDYLQQTCRR
jgi:RimK family alpha-L-glutamate ligase